ncbi:poly-beta-1,6 N-acetyl-D-glucosamine export porin PgaA [Thioalkalivibrio sulfidiphilus]|uniref:poly-beta-1,6 N-acetyl-D-glucosamine export porin PgaA n=1 Tax=Thioalkalivibrio sulfidiphilus TaxID=1033854 RepID=UPI001E4385E5|nr:poly-beta-1,6 N-acetyl-D-glucosamine export porin PgaA [Thioalkalivibrio sulfidiphilus]
MIVLPWALSAPGFANSLDQQRESAVELAREGRIDEAADRLRTLDSQFPNQPLLQADLIVVLRLAGDNAGIVVRTAGLDPESVPDYAHMSWAAALRDQGEFAAAANVLRESRKRLGTSAQILFAITSAEAGDTRSARQAIADIHPSPESAQELALMAYALRQSGVPHEALALANRARSRDPQHALAFQEQAMALWMLGASNRAFAAMQERPNLFEDDTRHRTEADVIATDIRQALDIRAEMEALGRHRERNQALDQALQRVDDFLSRIPEAHPQHLRVRLDRVALLRELERMADAIEAFEALPEPTAAPPFVRRAAADAYLAEQQPQAALPLYQSLIPEDEPPEASLLLDLYYTHIALEDYAAAADILDEAHRHTPVWLSVGPDRDPIPNWERVDVDHLNAYDAAYRQDLGLAWVRSGELVRQAPAHAGLRNTQARIARWRGWPARAREITEIAERWAPDARDTRLNRAENARDLGEHDTWRQEVDALSADYPLSRDVQRLSAELEDRDRPSIESELIFGRTSGGGGLVSGDRDRMWRTRLNSPWSAHAHRVFLEHRDSTATFDETQARHERIGAGVEWAARRKQAWVRIDRDLTNDTNPGVAAGWSQWLNDHWRFGIEADSVSMETPLRAIDAGLEGWSVSTSVDWRAHESLSAYARAGLLSINDGNRRTSLGTGVTRRVFANAHHATDLGADVYFQNNSQPGGPYFNPEQSASLSIRVDHQWITWRHYDRSLTQHFHAAAGAGYQSGFGSDPAIALRYEHRWSLDRRWGFDYGVGWGSTTYDGDREKRLFGLVRLRGIF